MSVFVTLFFLVAGGVVPGPEIKLGVDCDAVGVRLVAEGFAAKYGCNRATFLHSMSRPQRKPNLVGSGPNQIIRGERNLKP